MTNDITLEEFKQILWERRANYAMEKNLKYAKKTQPDMVSFIRKIYLLLKYPKTIYLPSSSTHYAYAKVFKITCYTRYRYLKENFPILNQFFKNLQLVRVDDSLHYKDIYHTFSYEDVDISAIDYYLFQNDIIKISEKGTIYVKR